MYEYDNYDQISEENNNENTSLKGSENSEEKQLEKNVQIYALSLDSDGLPPSGYEEEVLPPTQHIKLFLPFFIEELEVRHVRRHPTCFGFSRFMHKFDCLLTILFQAKQVLNFLKML